MVKSVVPNRIPSQNIVTRPLPIIDERDPNRLFLKQSAAIVARLEESGSYNKYISVPTSDYVIEKDNTEEEQELIDFINAPVILGEVNLSAIENVQSSVYYDSLGNPKIKYVLKIRNLALDKDNVEGVDARIYNPFA